MLKYLTVVILVLLASGEAMNSDEIDAMFMEIANECRADNPATDEEIDQLKSGKLPDSANAKCLLHCVLSTVGIMENGMLSVDAAHSLAEKHIDDPAEMSAVKELISLCKEINDKSVSDGNKGCDRAGLLFNCMMDNHTQFGLKF